MIQSPLHDIHVGFGAKLVDFAGWEMPLLYRGIIEEHHYTRNECSVFDVSHMGRLAVAGPGAQTFLQRICTRNMDGMVPGQCRYSHVCKQDGGILDDVIVSRFDEHDWGMVCNAANREKIVAWLNRHAEGAKITIDDHTLDTAMIAIQGPKTIKIMAEILPVDLSGLKRYRCQSGDLLGINYTIYRSGYTGEDGYELVLPAHAIPMAAPFLIGSADDPRDNIRPAGLGARDTLRTEAAMPLYGHELSEDIDSLSAGQGWCVDLDVDFIGADALRALRDNGLKVNLVGLEVEGKRIGRLNTPVMNGDRKVGRITSGTMSPTLAKNIAMALVDAESAGVDTELELDFNGKRAGARVVKLPFYKRPKQA